MEKHGLTIADIDAYGGSGKRGRKPGVKLTAVATSTAAKYRDPKTGATWTGHGRAPAWIADAKDRSKFLLEDGASQSVPTAKKTVRVGNYPRGPQAPKYRDPKSGATWSGRGRAPVWITSAKDRTAFLIEGFAEAGADVKTPASSKTAAKRAPAKKAASKKAVTRKPAAKRAAATGKATTAGKKIAAKKAGANKAGANKAVVKNTVGKKVASKKLATKKATTGMTTTAVPAVAAETAVASASN